MVKSKMLIVTTLAAVTVLSAMAAYMPVIPEADAHGVQAQLQSRFIRIEDESWSAQTLNTGDELTVTGTLQSLVNRPLRGWLSVFSESVNAGNRWEFISRDPPGNVFEIPPQGTIPYELTVRALEPGIYHVHTQLNVANVGPGLGPGHTDRCRTWGNFCHKTMASHLEQIERTQLTTSERNSSTSFYLLIFKFTYHYSISVFNHSSYSSRLSYLFKH